MKVRSNFFSVLLGFGVLVLTGCLTNDTTTFYELKSLRFELQADSATRGQQAEYFVIENCPTDLNERVTEIQAFNKRTLNVDKIESKQPSFYSRYFYQESSKLTRYYEEEDDFISDQIEDHIDDLIATVEYREKGNWVFKVKTEPNTWIEYPLE